MNSRHASCMAPEKTCGIKSGRARSVTSSSMVRSSCRGRGPRTSIIGGEAVRAEGAAPRREAGLRHGPAACHLPLSPSGRARTSSSQAASEQHGRARVRLLLVRGRGRRRFAGRRRERRARGGGLGLAPPRLLRLGAAALLTLGYRRPPAAGGPGGCAASCARDRHGARRDARGRRAAARARAGGQPCLAERLDIVVDKDEMIR